MIGFFLYLFYPILLQPNSYLFGNTGDGLKNYFTFTYYIQNNHSWTNFEGMNYPFGESIFYTDGHPLLAVIIKSIGNIFPSINFYGVGILNLLLLGSLVVTVLLLYKIIRHFSIHPTIALFGAFAITLLNPQNGRLAGHYALAYSCAIPMIIYFVILYSEKINCLKNGLIIGLICLVFFMTHAYLGIICSGIVILMALTLFLKQLIKKEAYRHSMWLFLSGILPLLLFYSCVKLTDIHVGRTTNPWGIYENHAELSTVFIPYITENMLRVFPFLEGIEQPWEGRAYIGLGTTILLISLLIRFIYLKLTPKKSHQKFIPTSFNFLLVSSVVLLLFALFIPFRFGYDDLLEKFAIVKQFRAIGRFTWPFYFVATLLFIIVGGKLYTHFIGIQKIKTAYFIGFIFPFLLFFEGHDPFVEKAMMLSKKENVFSTDNEHVTRLFSTIQKQQYQAILTLPFYSFGSENLGISGTDKLYKWSFIAAQQLQLPLFESYLTRISIGESKKSMQLLASDFYEKEIQKHFTSKKPFLVLYTHDHLSEKAYKIYKKCRLLVKGKAFDLLTLDYDDLVENSAKKEWKRFQQLKDNFVEKNGFLVSDTSAYFKFIGFSDPNTPFLNAKRNYFRAKPNDYNVLAKINGAHLTPHHSYTISCWMYNAGPNQGQDCTQGDFYIESIDKNGTRTWLPQHVFPTESHEINGKWTYISIELQHKDPTLSYEIMLLTSKKYGRHLRIDDVFIQDANLNVYKEIGPNLLFKNNHRIQLN
jgi:hypothetical protein